MPPRRLSNGRSPLVRKQSQITSFFAHGKSPKPDPSPSPSPNSVTSPAQVKQKRTPLLIPPSPASNPKTPSSAEKKGFKEEVVGKGIKVYWPVDDAWYEGSVKAFDELSGKHTVRYDDAEEEVLELGSEKVEFLEEDGAPRSLRRLRRLSGSKEPVVNKMVLEEDSSVEDSTDDDWGKGIEKDREDESEEEELEEEEAVVKSSGRSRSRSSGSKKRKKMEVGKLESNKKVKFEEDGENSASKAIQRRNGTSSIRPVNNSERGPVDSTLTGDAAERFGKREAEKFKFLCKGRKDAHGRQPGEKNYDPRTVYLPQEFLKSLSGAQRQWWEFKSKHMDKVLFFKMGKFYELFEMDAHIGAKELELQYMKGEQPHCGFPEKNFFMNLEKLARKGYRVLVIEQTETPEQLELRRQETGSRDKVVKREICAIVTKGTLTEGEFLSSNPNASYLMSITENYQNLDGQQTEGTILGVCVVDVSTSKFMVGQFYDDLDRRGLCSILSELRPVEIVKPSKVLSPETDRALKNHTRNPLVNDLVPLQEFWNADKTCQELKAIYGRIRHSPRSDSVNVLHDEYSPQVESRSGFLPDVLSELVNSGENGVYALSALGGCFFYLRQAFLDEALLKCAKFELLPCLVFLNAFQSSYMILDAAALENLEILENNRNGGSFGTLFAQLDHCMTAFGKRLLRGWLARPLSDVGAIVGRQNAIAGLKGVGLSSAFEFRKELSRLPDMERLLARLFASCEVSGRNANRVVFYEDAARKQLREFVAALRGCEVMAQACSSLSTILANIDSCLLHHLLTPGKGLPDTRSILKHFKDSFNWSEADHSGRIIPHEGGDVEYDTTCKTVKNIESCLTSYLKEQRKVLGDSSINYVTVGKELYLLEVPESLGGTVPHDYELRASKKGYFRYSTPTTRKWLSELSQAETEKEAQLKSILQRFIWQFSEHHQQWRRLVSVTAELDALISLGIASDYFEGPTCCPIIERPHSNEILPTLTAKSLGHPVLRSDALGKGLFVPNDISIGGLGNASFILLTGPNMGGKSTLLRQVCMAVILAQLGANVPAERFELSPVDRIFVRMGARDHIMAGQSTFLTELTETASILSSATQNSLVALDELGRGTSTSDGQAIAGSVLEYLVHKVQCRGLFSTHYHRLAVDYEKDPKVSLCHMACQVGKAVGGVEEVTFLYRLATGSCPKSYGVNVARLAGIPASVLQKAMIKSSEFESTYGLRGHDTEDKNMGMVRDDEVAIIRSILCTAEAWNHHRGTQPFSQSVLLDIQEKAQLLVNGS